MIGRANCRRGGVTPPRSERRSHDRTRKGTRSETVAMKGRGEISEGRRSIRVKGFDYSQDGAYYVTICTHRRECTLGSVEGNAVQLTELGRAAEESWQGLPVRYPHLTVDALVVMPNHVHVILVIDGTECRGGGATPAPTKRSYLGADCRLHQIPIDEANQRTPRNTRRTSLAAELLRAHHPKRRRSQTHSGVHREQPIGVERRPGEPGFSISEVRKVNG